MGIKTTLDEYGKHIRFDIKLITTLEDFILGFIGRNDEHRGFFGDILIGVHRPKMLPADQNYILQEVLGFEVVELRKRLHALPSINVNFKVISNEFYQTLMWVTHRFLVENKLSKDNQMRGALAAVMIFQLKAITSKITNDFHYKNDEEVALAVAASLSKKFSIKKHGSWYRVLVARAEDLLSPKSIHYKTLRNYTIDETERLGINYAISDTQGRIKELIATQWKTIREVIENDKRVIGTKSTINVDGEEILRDLTRNANMYISYLLNIAGSEKDFIKMELVELTAGLTLRPVIAKVQQTLAYISKWYAADTTGDAEEFLREVALHAFDALYQARGNSAVKISVPEMLITLRGKYSSGRTTDPTLHMIRDTGDRIVTIATRTSTSSVVATTRTVVLMYIVGRMLLKNRV